MAHDTNVWIIFDRRTWILLSLFILAIPPVKARCLSHEYDLDNKRCCRKCAPGSGVTSHCSYTNNTVCDPCSHGETFSGLHSHAEICRPCNKCVENANHVRRCNVTHNAICQCNEDFYYENGKCNMCSKCLPGWGASLPCSHKHNTICRKCPNGTFSDLLSGTSGCWVCTKCNDNQEMLQPCSSMQDTLCIDKPGRRHYKSPTLVRGGPVTDKAQVPHDEGSDFIILYCAVPGFIVIAVLIYVLIRRRRKAFGSRSLKHDADSFRTCPENIVFVDHEGRTVTVTTKVRDLPPVKRKEIELTLQKNVAGRPSWTGLARELGYNKARIASMETKAKQEHISSSKCLFIEWSKSENATVGVLIRALKNIGRIDIVKMLHGQPSVMVVKHSASSRTTKGNVGPVNV